MNKRLTMLGVFFALAFLLTTNYLIARKLASKNSFKTPRVNTNAAFETPTPTPSPKK